MKKLALLSVVSVLLSGCVTREVIRTVEVPTPVSPSQGSTITVKNCNFKMKFGESKPNDAGMVKLLQRTDGTYLQMLNGNIIAVENSSYNEEMRQTLFFVSHRDKAGMMIIGMAYNCF